PDALHRRERRGRQTPPRGDRARRRPPRLGAPGHAPLPRHGPAGHRPATGGGWAMSAATVLPAERRGAIAALPELPPGADPTALLQQARPLDTGLSADYLEHHGVLPLGQRDGRLVV